MESPSSLLVSAEGGIYVVVPLVGPRLHLWNCGTASCVGLPALAVSGLSPVKPRSSLDSTEDPVLSVRLVFHRHVVASVALPTSPSQPLFAGPENTSHIVTNHFLPTDAELQSYNCMFGVFWTSFT